MSFLCAHDGYTNYSLAGENPVAPNSQVFWVNEISNLPKNTTAPFTCVDSKNTEYYVSPTMQYPGAPPATDLFGNFSCSITPEGTQQVCYVAPDACQGLCQNGSKCVAGQCDCSTARGRTIDSCWGADGDAPPDDKHSPAVVLTGKYCDTEYLPRLFVTSVHNEDGNVDMRHSCHANTAGLNCEPGTSLVTTPKYYCNPQKGNYYGQICSAGGNDDHQAGLDHACSR